jgi:hypothetical protein
MHRQATSAPVGRSNAGSSSEVRERIAGVNLLGVCVTALATIHASECERRQQAGIEAVTDPDLLSRLADLPVAVAVADPVAWAETADQPAGVIGRNSDGFTVTRHLAPPLAIEDVIVTASAGRELNAVQDASLFAGFARRWVTIAGRRPPEPALLEAKLCGVGLLHSSGRMVLGSDEPTPRMDCWAWMLQEKAYRRWLSQRSQAHTKASQPPATAGATERLTG